MRLSSSLHSDAKTLSNDQGQPTKFLYINISDYFFPLFTGLSKSQKSGHEAVMQLLFI